MEKYEVKCNFCGNSYFVKPYLKNRTKFCSRKCQGKYQCETKLKKIDKSYLLGNKFASGSKNNTSFKKGHIPWNKGIKGLHLSPDTELKKGESIKEKVFVGTIRTRKDKNGKKRNYIKVKNPNIWIPLYKFIWEKENGKTPNGYVIHHINYVSDDDRLENLILLSRKEHINVHRTQIEKKEIEKGQMTLF